MCGVYDISSRARIQPERFCTIPNPKENHDQEDGDSIGGDRKRESGGIAILNVLQISEI